MRYILAILLIFFIGCDKKTKHIKTKQTKIKTDQFKINDLNLTFKNNKLIYPNKKMIILFYDNNFYSKEEIRILKKLNVKFYKTNDKFLINYFNIKYFPTIVILDKNKTIKFENFTPYEILKTEGF